jgi:hypothetical protein
LQIADNSSYLVSSVRVLFLKAVFRIRDILLRIRILGSVLWIVDPDSAPDPTPDPDLLGSGFQNANKKDFLFAYFLL